MEIKPYFHTQVGQECSQQHYSEEPKSWNYLSVDEWVNKMWHICTNRDEDTDTCYNMSEHWKHFAGWKKPVRKDHIF